MASFNKVILLGNLTRDPQVRYIASGSAVCDIGLAVNRYWFDKASNTKKEETTFVDVTLWGRDAEVAGEYLSKGRPVLIEGRLKLDQWDDKQTGQKRSRLVVVGESMQLLGGRDGGGAPGGAPRQGAARQQQPAQSPAEYQDDAPSYDPPVSRGGGGGGDDEPPF